MQHQLNMQFFCITWRQYSISDPLSTADVLPLSTFLFLHSRKNITKSFLPLGYLLPVLLIVHPSYLPHTSPTVANHRGRQRLVSPLSQGRFTFAQVLLSKRHQISFLMEGKADRALTPSWLFPLEQTSSYSVTAQSTDCII